MNRARAADRALAKGEVWGPLHGLPMTVKESFDLVGQPTTWGHLPRKDHAAAADALVVDRLKAAGAVVFGKSNVPLNLADFQSYNAVYGTTNNPWDLTRGPGGSSGGSAAMMAAGLSALEYGSDIGGSIRNPAAYCGVYGHKSTWCIVPKRGHSLAPKPGAEADLSVIGPLARSAGDLAPGAEAHRRRRRAQRPRPAVQAAGAAEGAEGPARRRLAGRAHRPGGRQREGAHRGRGARAGQGRRQGGLQGPARPSTRCRRTAST